MTIITDSREKAHIIGRILDYFDHEGIKHYSSKLIVGDYMNIDNPRRVVDRKFSLSELANNLTNDSGRFMREIRLAKELGIHMIVLCEQGAWIKGIRDVAQWHNPMQGKIPYAISGKDLMERIYRVHIAYDVDFLFCDKRSTGKKIVELLTPRE
ncbi:MAG: ERCC4 domain-containing protein [Candidatus Flemingiibacterium sp.]